MSPTSSEQSVECVHSRSPALQRLHTHKLQNSNTGTFSQDANHHIKNLEKKMLIRTAEIEAGIHSILRFFLKENVIYIVKYEFIVTSN